MSFDLYLQAFQNGKAAGMAPEIIRNAFGKYVIEIEEDFWQVQYGADESSDIFYSFCQMMLRWFTRYPFIGLAVISGFGKACGYCLNCPEHCSITLAVLHRWHEIPRQASTCRIICADHWVIP